MFKLYVLLLVPCLYGCSAMDTYLEDRALDFTDVIDPKYGWAFPACAKVEVTDYLATGLGLAKAWDTHESGGEAPLKSNDIADRYGDFVVVN